ncbi:hypothetical protein [Effusibacillus consociatus]|uniref:Uncharacterized protein n=1 Tax=Effusibacillus consociatus TaxID=1117041 RepID=A0ABV9Q2A7_9BACL
MTMGQQFAGEQAAQPIEWKLAIVTGLLLGGVAGLLSLFGKQFYNWAVPGGMMIASWVAVNRAQGRRFWAGLNASLVAGVLGWLIYLIWNYSNLAAGGTVGQALLLSAAFLVPLFLIISVFGSWVFSRTRERVLAAQEKRRLEEKAKKKEMYKNRPKRKYKKKK